MKNQYNRDEAKKIAKEIATANIDRIVAVVSLLEKTAWESHQVLATNTFDLDNGQLTEMQKIGHLAQAIRYLNVAVGALYEYKNA